MVAERHAVPAQILAGNVGADQRIENGFEAAQDDVPLPALVPREQLTGAGKMLYNSIEIARERPAQPVQRL